MTTPTTPADRAADRREKARLRSERARRARGVKPRPKAKQPWFAAGISRSTWGQDTKVHFMPPSCERIGNLGFGKLSS
jgi:hypothetical protein